jgi:hypothetical protein
VRGVGGLRQGKQAELQAVADAELRDADAVFRGQGGDLGVVQQGACATGE